MNYKLLFLALITWVGGIDDIATVNRLKTRAKSALEQKNYALATTYYTKLVDSLQVDDEAVRLNLAHALLLSGDTAQSQLRYSQLTSSQSSELKSVAYQQLGVLASGQKKYPEALATFKESLKANPKNEAARYNYELVKRLLEQQQQEQNQENQEKDDQQKESQEDQEKQKQEGDKKKEEGEQGEDQEGEPQDQQSGEQEPQDAEEQEAQEGEQSEGEKDQEQSSSPVSDKLKEMNISEEKAQMILEAMRNNEMQYIQQNRRKPQKPRDRTKPDW